MGTRSGEVDRGLLVYLIRSVGMTAGDTRPMSRFEALHGEQLSRPSHPPSHKRESQDCERDEESQDRSGSLHDRQIREDGGEKMNSVGKSRQETKNGRVFREIDHYIGDGHGEKQRCRQTAEVHNLERLVEGDRPASPLIRRPPADMVQAAPY